MLTRRPVKEKVAVTGVLDLSGNILQVDGLREKLTACQEADIETLLVPELSLADFSIESLPADLRYYAYKALRGVRTMTDVILLSIQGQSVCIYGHHFVLFPG
jgi:ATP-dependent Lon protease